MAAGPPNMWSAMAALPDVSPEQPAASAAVSGAAPLSPHIRQQVADRLGVELAEGYGLTETALTVTLGRSARPPAGSIGRVAPGIEVRLVDETAATCSSGIPARSGCGGRTCSAATG
ncbi:MAG: AMP-binding protein [Acidimicrobiales bacterium]